MSLINSLDPGWQRVALMFGPLSLVGVITVVSWKVAANSSGTRAISMTPGTASIRPENREKYVTEITSKLEEVERLRREETVQADDGQWEPLFPEVVKTRGGIAKLREDTWALHVYDINEKKWLEWLLADLTANKPPLSSAKYEASEMSGMTVGADIIDAKALAKEWAAGNVYVDASGNKWTKSLIPKSWIKITRTGTVSDGHKKPKKVEPFKPDDIPLEDMFANHRGDSAGLSLFLAYAMDYLKIAERSDCSIAASGDMVGNFFQPIGGVEEKVAAAKIAGARVMILPYEQKIDLRVLNSFPAIIQVPDDISAAAAYLSARAQLEKSAP